MQNFNLFFCKTETVEKLEKVKEIIVDSKMSFEESIKNTKAPQKIINKLELIDVEYYSFDNKLHRGQLLVNKEVTKDLIEIFAEIKKTKFPIKKVIPIVKYQWSDSASMADNNASSFNYRTVSGTKRLSNHAFGKAIDINPIQNPYKSKSGVFSPKNSTYKPNSKGTLAANSTITKLFIKKGWKWGGNYKSIKDWQHFDKK